MMSMHASVCVGVLVCVYRCVCARVHSCTCVEVSQFHAPCRAVHLLPPLISELQYVRHSFLGQEPKEKHQWSTVWVHIQELNMPQPSRPWFSVASSHPLASCHMDLTPVIFGNLSRVDYFVLLL